MKLAANEFVLAIKVHCKVSIPVYLKASVHSFKNDSRVIIWAKSTFNRRINLNSRLSENVLFNPIFQNPNFLEINVGWFKAVEENSLPCVAQYPPAMRSKKFFY